MTEAKYECDNSNPTPSELEAASAQLLKAMGTKGCDNTNSSIQGSTSAQATVSAPFVNAGASVTASYVDNFTHSIGCEQLTVAAKSFAKATKNISCMLMKTESTSDVKVSFVNDIAFLSEGDLVMTDVTIDQSIDIRLVYLSNMSSAMKQEIANNVKAVATQALEAIQESKTGVGATPQGAKAISDEKIDVNDANISKTVENAIQKANFTVTGGNKLVFDKTDITFKNVKIKQSTVADIAATIIMGSAIGSLLSGTNSVITEQTDKIVQKAENLGVDTLGRQAGDASVAMTKAITEGSNMMMIGAIILGVMILGGGGMGALTGGGERSAPKLDSKGDPIPGTRKLLPSSNVIAVICIILGLSLGGFAAYKVWWVFKGYDDEYLNYLNTMEKDVKKCMVQEDAEDDTKCDFTKIKIKKYDNPIEGKIGWIALACVSAMLLFFGLSRLIF